jgi:hypothetical protein
MYSPVSTLSPLQITRMRTIALLFPGVVFFYIFGSPLPHSTSLPWFTRWEAVACLYSGGNFKLAMVGIGVNFSHFESTQSPSTMEVTILNKVYAASPVDCWPLCWLLNVESFRGALHNLCWWQFCCYYWWAEGRGTGVLIVLSPNLVFFFQGRTPPTATLSTIRLKLCEIHITNMSLMAFFIAVGVNWWRKFKTYM